MLMREVRPPRFIDDAAAAKLLQAARTDPDPFVRLAVEFLARIGLRLGEFLDRSSPTLPLARGRE